MDTDIALLTDLDSVLPWLNESLPANGSLTELDRQLATLVGALEIAAEETATELERTIDDVARHVPRLSYDLHLIRDGALSLNHALDNLHDRSRNTAAGDASQAFDHLQNLDLAKGRMQTAREVLREAQSWTTLESEVTALLAEQNYDRAADRLSEANKSIGLFENTPEYEPRRTLLVSLQNELEASLSSALVSAISTQDVIVCHKFFSIFSNIEREYEFRSYYYGSRRGPVASLWQDASLSDCESSSGPPNTTTPSFQGNFASFLPVFYANFLSMLDIERVSIPSIFPDPQNTLSSLISTTFGALQPAMSHRLEAVSIFHGPRALSELIAAFKATEDFGLAVEKLVEKIGYSLVPSQSPPETRIERSSSGTGRPHSRRRSERLSISRRAEHRLSIGGGAGLFSSSRAAAPSGAMEWEQTLFSPFLNLQADYANLEQRLLDAAMQGIMMAQTRSSRQHQDSSRIFKERSVDVMSLAQDALMRCMAFTHGYGFPQMLGVIDHTFASFVDSTRQEISNASKDSTFPQLPGTVDLADLDYTASDWSNIQECLHMLDATHSFSERAVAFESKLRTSLAQLSANFRLMREEPSGNYTPDTSRGEVHLLEQSVLNSASLRELLETVDAYDGEPPRTGPKPLLSVHPGRIHASADHDAWSLFERTRVAISVFACSCQSDLQSTILSPLRKNLAAYATLADWTASGDARAKRLAGGSDLQVPLFSLSPTATMQEVAEGLLNLPRLFEVYADDTALAFSLDTLPHLQAGVLSALRSHDSQHNDSADSPAHSGVSSRDRRALSPEGVSSAWLSSLGMSLLAHVTGEILPSIKSLTSAGAAQLASDLGYLSTIVHALNVEDLTLEQWKATVGLDDNSGRAALANSAAEGGAVLALIAKMRGW